jgi:putative tryptophan/tyrosine transport system substrate-binding protein
MDPYRRLALLAIAVAPLCVHAQQGKTARLGVLATSNARNLAQYIDAFRGGLRDLGYSEGKNLFIEYRYAEGKHDRLSRYAAELVKLKVDAIVTEGTVATQAAKEATRGIPIVMALVADPIAGGFAHTLARPGANITGVTTLSLELLGKQLELLEAIVPTLANVTVFVNPAHPAHERALPALKAAAEALKIDVALVRARDAAELDEAFAVLAKRPPQALIWISAPEYDSQQVRMAQFALQHRLPAVYSKTAFADAGGLVSYGADFPDLFRRAATYVDRVLRGSLPQEMPVEQPSKFELVINARTGRELGLRIPRDLLITANRVIS